MFEWCDACSCLAEAAQLVTERQTFHCRTSVHVSHPKEGSLPLVTSLLEFILRHLMISTRIIQALLRLYDVSYNSLVSRKWDTYFFFFLWDVVGFDELFRLQNCLSCTKSVKFWVFWCDTRLFYICELVIEFFIFANVIVMCLFLWNYLGD